jgi:hypothetical protein
MKPFGHVSIHVYGRKIKMSMTEEEDDEDGDEEKDTVDTVFWHVSRWSEWANQQEKNYCVC